MVACNALASGLLPSARAAPFCPIWLVIFCYTGFTEFDIHPGTVQPAFPLQLQAYYSTSPGNNRHHPCSTSIRKGLALPCDTR